MKKAISSTRLILMPIISLLILQVIIAGVAVTPVLASTDGWSAHPLIHVRRAATPAPTGLAPTQIRAAYNLPPTGGTGTIAVVDAYDDPTVQNDLSVFSSQFGLPSITGANFEKHMMASGIRTDSGWALEISLDVQWAHAIAPNAKILLVEARSNSLTDLLAAVDYARNRADVVAVSMSWGAYEFSTEASYDYHFTSPYGALFFASSGDSGAGVIWPAASPNVIAVGGTTLTFGAGGSLASETAWRGSGGGLSSYESEPSYQVLYNVPGANGRRAVPDVSYDADPNSGVSVYDSTPYSGQSGWWQVGGTSAGAPQWAAIQSLGLSASDSNFYQLAASSSYSSHLRDITSGSNGYAATTGYDYVTGLGSPLTTNFAPVTTPDFSISASPSALTIAAGGSGSPTLTVTSLNGFSGEVSLAASAPSGLSAALSSSFLTVTSGGSASSTLSITVPTDAGAGIYTVTVTGTSDSLSHSTAVTVNVQTVPSAPQNLKATAGNAQVALSWSAPSSSGGSVITSYKIYRGTVSGGEELLITTGNVLTYTDTTATNGQTYYYQVTAVNSIGESGMSNEASATPSASAAKAMSVVVKTDRSTYSRGSTVTITVTVKDGTTGSPLRGASVAVTVYYPSGSVAGTGSGTTGSSGTVRLSFRLGSKTRGTYKVVATASLAGYQTGTGQTNFNVA